MDRRRLLLGGGAAVAVAATAAACSAQSGGTGTGVTQNAGNVNDMVVQQGELTVNAWNRVKDNPGQAYPVDLLNYSLELAQQREKLLRFNVPDKTGYAYCFSTTGQLICYFPVKGKVSSTQSSMTAATGVYSDGGSGGGGNVPVDVPGDDLSFGINEGGDAGQFFFTTDGVYVYWPGPILYLDAPLDVLQQPAAVQYRTGSAPSSTAPGSTLFK